MSQSPSPVPQQNMEDLENRSEDNSGPSTKRRRLNSDSPTPSEDRFSPEIAEYNIVVPNEEHDRQQATESSKMKKAKNPLSRNKVAESREAIAKTGVIYLSRIPPRLNPTKIRQLLSVFESPVLRIFLAPETTTAYQRRVKAGGSKRKQFTEGWVEFEDKKVAKKVAVMLNAERIGAKKGDFCYDDLWCIKYLPKFKWHHLTEQIGITIVCVLLTFSVQECFSG
jgi:ESF2/ABP1 family protein